MSSSRELFWQWIIKERHDAFMAFGPGSQGVPLKTAEFKYLALQKKLLEGARTDWERQHIKRLIAHDILTVSYLWAHTWAEYERALRRVQQLGYPSVEYRMHAACETLEWAADRDPTKAPLGWALVADAERRLRRMRRKHHVRKQALAAIASVKQRVTRKGLTPPTPPGKSKGMSRRRESHLRSRPLPPTA
jgi:hypothetical protein